MSNNKIKKSPKITIDPNILSGKPVVAGTRISVEIILDLLSSGLGVKDIVAEYPSLSREAVLAAIAYSNDVLKREEIYPLEVTKGGVVFSPAL